MQVLLQAIREELPENIEKELVFFVVFLAENSQNLASKSTCARLLGVLAEVFFEFFEFFEFSSKKAQETGVSQEFT